MPIHKASRSYRRRTGSRTGSQKSPAPRRSAGISPRRQAAHPPPARSSLLGGLSPERKIDLVGVLMALIGLLTFLSLFSTNRSDLTGSWVGILSIIFGWGVFILPVALILVGVWLIARRIERLPRLSVERIVGFILLFINLLVVFHALAGPLEAGIANALAGRGGGYTGNVILQGLASGLGIAGSIIAVIAWLLIALTMSLDLSIQELFQWAGPFITRLRQRQQKQSNAQPAPPQSRQPESVPPAQKVAPVSTPPQTRPLTAEQRNIRVTTQPAPSGTAVVHWSLPSIKDILEIGQTPAINEEFIKKRARLIEETLASFGAPSQVVEISRGPTITMFGVEPNFIETRAGRTRVRVSKIVALVDDLALALAAPRIRIQAPVPGRSYVGIEVPNEEMTLVTLREVVESEIFQRLRLPLRFALGKDVSGHPVTSDMTTLPHLLIAGTTGSGKSVCVNAILTCLLLHNTPDDLRLILVDPKRVELTGYNGVPHLLAPVVVEIERVVGALQWMMREMDNRYHTFAQAGARNIADYNHRMQAQGGKKLPYLIVVIDELADLMLISPDETERTITRLAQLARATGIHLIIATQRPSVDVVTGLIKANFPARIAFAVASGVDSRVILDQPGAERLLGRGDMLYQSPDAPTPVRLQGVFVSDMEIQRLVDYWHEQAGLSSPYALPGMPVDIPQPGGAAPKQVPLWEHTQPTETGDPLLKEAIDLIRREGRASVSMLQRRLRIGYTRAARLIDMMEDKGIVSPPEGNSGLRRVLDYGPAAPPKED